MSAISAAHQTIKGWIWLLTLTLSSLGQITRPDFTGVWRSRSITLGPMAKSITEIEQTDSTLALRQVIPNETTMEWFIYSTDGKVMKTKMGRHLIDGTGHWEGNQLILRETGPGNAPWRRSTEQRILSLSSDGQRMTMEIHNLSDKKSFHDYAIEFERILSRDAAKGSRH